MLTRYWATKAYQDICDKRPWSWLRAESEFLINTQKTGTVNVTRNSATVSGGSMSYASSDADRQFRISPGPVYTIIAADATSYTLDRVYGGATATAASATVLDAYITVPSDFQRFLAVIDVSNNWQLHLWITEDELNSWDAQRSSSGTAWAVVSRRLATAGALTGRIQYELWPYCTSEKNYPYYYIRRPEDLTDDTAFLGPLAKDSNIMVSMALAQCAKWPGVEGKRNPYFNLALAAQLDKEADQALDRMMVLDEEIYMTWLQTVNYSRIPFAPLDSRYLQNHDADWGVPWPH
jgi:hypothetical protein